ncbi:MAG TPA: phosphoenolpyruvate--protein phosphotransferase [Rhodospirillaceae bacterium]|nr:phosphoenolpyruvate--protein phosphotransferase [Candidatus Neomarinimicrobiota bacterium]HCX14699.1 phosphoenolpyruvate--protein phosphotransferase [Rhodospirillaceae bacterium]
MLSRLRDVMAGGGEVQGRLDKVVKLIAKDLKADVCSCYVMRAGEVLELFATYGLSQRAVHLTRLRVGEGLVGEVAAHARALALADAWSHPLFVYRPETGEDFFRSLMAVPMIQAGRVVGVLVVQTREDRPFNDWELETLETVAMVIAELMAAAQVVKREELFQAEGNALLPVRLTGVTLNPGVGIGVAVMHKPHVRIGRLVSDDPKAELARLHKALNTLRKEVDTLIGGARGEAAGFGDILEVYRMFADDRGWINRISEAIASGLTTEAAVQKAHDDTSIRMQQLSDPIFRERLQDLDDLSNRLLNILNGGSLSPELPENAILVCRSLGPTELLEYDTMKLKGLVMEEGSPTMHATVVAKTLDIPVVAQVKGAHSRIDAFDQIVLDANVGQVILRPADELLDLYSSTVEAHAQQVAAYAAIRELPAVTEDGIAISLCLNAGFLIDMQNLFETNADGIGLYRTEMPFLSLPSFPDVGTQQSFYAQVFAKAAGKSVTFRTLDVGGDKIAAASANMPEDNPALGWRSIRLTLDRPALLRQQLRALIRSAAGQNLRVMFPMIASVAEFDAARRLLDIELECHADRHEEMPASVKVGTMLEVPSLLWQLDKLLKRVDFISVGTNDLLQFIFAADRGNTRVASRYDALSPAALRILRMVVEECEESGVDVSVCGEMAGQPLDALVLIALGYRTLSMSASGVGPVRAMIRGVRLSEIEPFVAQLLNSTEASVRERLRAFVRDRNILLG